MLAELRIQALGVIAEATIALSPGLTVVTGETGAGKTMVVTGLQLLFGGRAGSGRVRVDADRAWVEGRLRLPADSPALHLAADAGADCDEDGDLLISRSVSAEGRSRAALGGRGVPIGLLAELAADVLVVHGQGEQVRLMRPAEQRAALDRYAGEPVIAVRERYREQFARWRVLVDDLAERAGHARERAQEAELLRYGVSSIAAVDPQPGEDAALEAELARLSFSDLLKKAAQDAHEALVGDPAGDGADVSTLLGTARRSVGVATEHDPELAALESRLAEIGYLAADVAGDLASYADRIEADPLRLQQVLERQAALQGLRRSYADTIDEVIAWAGRAAARLLELDSSEETLSGLRAARDGAAADTARLAGELSAARSAAADRFTRAVTAELQALAMPEATVEVAVRRRPTTGPAPVLQVGGTPAAAGPDGVDEVELLLAAHPGAPLQPLQRGASGGELSRVMLAVEVVFAAADPVPVMVFDEVDAGVGGRAAIEVGRRLARLARDHQVLVVTHLPQVAAYADTHLVVDKASGGRVTCSHIRRLGADERRAELGRMLAGQEGSAHARAHAEELLAAATRDKTCAKTSAKTGDKTGEEGRDKGGVGAGS